MTLIEYYPNQETIEKAMQVDDGFADIAKAIKEIDYECEIDIPRRYRRHLEIFHE